MNRPSSKASSSAIYGYNNSNSGTTIYSGCPAQTNNNKTQNDIGVGNGAGSGGPVRKACGIVKNTNFSGV